MGKTNRLLAVVLLSAGVSAPVWAQLRVCEWNVTVYGVNSQSQGRDGAFQTALYGHVPAPLAYAGKSMSPDVIVGQEFTSAAGVTAFVAMLNGAPGSPGDWTAAVYHANVAPGDTSVGAGAFFYRTSRLQPVAGTTIAPVIVSVGVAATNGIPPRNTERFDARLAGYGADEGAIVSFYCSHAKSGSTASDIDKRTTEFSRIATNAQGLAVGRLYMFCADTNTQSSAQAGYQALVNNGGSPGPFWDPINSPGSWENNGAFRFIHTQDPAPSGQMDSRHDQILISNTIRDGAGFEYIGNSNLTFAATWNDPIHSFRCWGNDGSGNGTTDPLPIANNTEVGSVIAQALRDTAAVNATGGHLPVYADFKVPAKATASAASIPFGTVNQNVVASQTLTVTNTGDTAKWNIAGIANLKYYMTITGGFTVTNAGTAGSPNTEAPGGGFNSHTVAMPTGTAGVKSGTLTIFTDAPEMPTITIALSGTVVIPPPSCPADIGVQGGTAGHDGILDNNDFVAFIDLFFAQDSRADFGIQGGQAGHDGLFDNNDFVVFIDDFFAGCPA